MGQRGRKRGLRTEGEMKMIQRGRKRKRERLILKIRNMKL
jgi:hypothetical protein